jgi:hypothetical protein
MIFSSIADRLNVRGKTIAPHKMRFRKLPRNQNNKILILATRSRGLFQVFTKIGSALSNEGRYPETTGASDQSGKLSFIHEGVR